LEVSDDLVVVGYPGNLDVSPINVKITSFGSPISRDIWTVDKAIPEGSSGSPVFDLHNGVVVGTAVGRSLGNNPFGYIIPIGPLITPALNPSVASCAAGFYCRLRGVDDLRADATFLRQAVEDVGRFQARDIFRKVIYDAVVAISLSNGVLEIRESHFFRSPPDMVPPILPEATVYKAKTAELDPATELQERSAYYAIRLHCKIARCVKVSFQSILGKGAWVPTSEPSWDDMFLDLPLAKDPSAQLQVLNIRRALQRVISPIRSDQAVCEVASWEVQGPHC
jgi:hypothetical protein